MAAPKHAVRKKPKPAAPAQPSPEAPKPPTNLSDWFKAMPTDVQIRFAAELVERSYHYGDTYGTAARKSAAVALRVIADRLDQEDP